MDKKEIKIRNYDRYTIDQVNEFIDEAATLKPYLEDLEDLLHRDFLNIDDIQKRKDALKLVAFGSIAERSIFSLYMSYTDLSSHVITDLPTILELVDNPTKDCIRYFLQERLDRIFDGGSLFGRTHKENK